MRARRRVPVALATLVVAALPAGHVASAAGGPHRVTAAHESRVVSRTGLPRGVFGGPSACKGGKAKGTIEHVMGPGKPPLGKGSLELTADAHSAGALVVPFSQKQLHHATTMKLSTDYLAGGGFFVTGVQFADDGTAPTGDGGGDLLYLAQSGSGWVTSNLLTATLTWQRYGVTDPIGTGTLREYEAAHPRAQIVNWGAVDLDCHNGLASDFAVDDLQVGVDHNTTIYDFEQALATALVGRVSASSITAGDDITPSVKLTSLGKPINGREVVLLKTGAGAGRYRKVAIATTNKHGVATAKVQRPTATSRYRWRFAGDETHAASTSAPNRVRVSSHR